MDLRIGQRLLKPQDTALLALKQQQLQHQLFLASLHQQQVEHRLRLSGVPGHPGALGRGPARRDPSEQLRAPWGPRAGAVASTVVKQKLAEVILKKQQAALERSSAAPAAALPYRSLEPLEPEGPSPTMLSTFLSPVPSTSLDAPEHFPLRKTGTASGMSLCPSWLEGPGGLCPHPMSFPPPDSSPSSSSTPVSGCSSPNDSLPAEHAALPAPGGAHEVSPALGTLGGRAVPLPWTPARSCLSLHAGRPWGALGCP
uniref:Histone deacetylase n=1 Tax=Serinus canaria TaxID=9135 RepID=A0A8C9UC77_SERCA